MSQDQISKDPFPAGLNLFNRLTEIARSRGLLIYPRRCLAGLAGDHFLITSPLNSNQEETETLLHLLHRSLIDL